MKSSIAIDPNDVDFLPLSQLQQAQLRQAHSQSGQLHLSEVRPGQVEQGQVEQVQVEQVQAHLRQGQHQIDSGQVESRKAKPGPRGRNRQGRGLIRVVGEWIAIIVVALSVALLVRATVVQAFWIPSTSMTPTLKVGDRLLVDKVSFQVREIHRGEIIVFERPATLKEDFKDLIKRVVGLPGDTVEGHDGGVFVNGKRLAEPYLHAGLTTKDFPPQQVPIDNYFVMGDNREVSWDSRYWGTVERKLVVGKAIVRVWPPSQIGRL